MHHPGVPANFLVEKQFLYTASQLARILLQGSSHKHNMSGENTPAIDEKPKHMKNKHLECMRTNYSQCLRTLLRECQREHTITVREMRSGFDQLCNRSFRDLLSDLRAAEAKLRSLR